MVQAEKPDPRHETAEQALAQRLHEITATRSVFSAGENAGGVSSLLPVLRRYTFIKRNVQRGRYLDRGRAAVFRRAVFRRAVFRRTLGLGSANERSGARLDLTEWFPENPGFANFGPSAIDC